MQLILSVNVDHETAQYRTHLLHSCTCYSENPLFLSVMCDHETAQYRMNLLHFTGSVIQGILNW